MRIDDKNNNRLSDSCRITENYYLLSQYANQDQYSPYSIANLIS